MICLLTSYYCRRILSTCERHFLNISVWIISKFSNFTLRVNCVFKMKTNIWSMNCEKKGRFVFNDARTFHIMPYHFRVFIVLWLVQFWKSKVCHYWTSNIVLFFGTLDKHFNHCTTIPSITYLHWPKILEKAYRNQSTRKLS